jgi:putative two-component system response regulator
MEQKMSVPPIPILIVDDNPDLLRMYQLTLPLMSDDTFAITVANDGVAALDVFYAASPRPACVVIDIKMPQLDGYQLVRLLRGDPDSADTPLVILTAMAQDYQRFNGLASGADHYLLKPIEPSDLIAAIHRAIALSHEERERRYQSLAESQ